MRKRAKYNGRTKDNRLARVFLATACAGALLTTAGAGMTRADEPGNVLRGYLQARMQGDLETARQLWDGRDARRASAMGIRFADIEATYDDYWMLSRAEREARAATMRAVVRDSVLDDDHATFTVVLESTAGTAADTLKYFLRRSGETWQISLPYLHATRGWTRREGRFVRLRSKRLIRVSTAGLNAMDRAIEQALVQLGAPETAVLRLERIKLEYYLCDSDDDVRMLVGTAGRGRYLPAGQRIVTRTNADMNAVARALLHLRLRKTPLHFVPLLAEGVPAAVGGDATTSGAVYTQRARNLARKHAETLELPLDAMSLDAKHALPMAAAWCSALLAQLEPTSFEGLARALGGTHEQVAALTPDDVAAALRTATGEGRRAMVRGVSEHLDALPVPLVPGCERWPNDIRGLNPTLQWRGASEEWGLMAYEIDDQYVVTVSPYEPGPPPWMRDMVDSLQAELADNSLEWMPPSTGADRRIDGDPPVIVVLVRAKLEEDVEVYESRLFAEHFLVRNYKNELFGLFVSPHDARLFDYSQDKLIAEYSVRDDPPSKLEFYDSEKQRICFRFPIDFIPRRLTAYYVALQEYSGE